MFSVHLQLLLVSCLFLADLVYSEEEVADTKTHDDSLSRTKRAGLNMLRLGRGLQMLRMGKRADFPMLRMGKRADFPMLRMGRSDPQFNTDEDDAIRQLIIDILTQQAADREYFYPEYYPYPPTQLRYRRSLSEFPEKSIDIPNLEKLTEGGEEEMKEQEVENFPESEGYPVFADEVEYKNEDEKRPMSMLRMGKRPMSMLRMGKRPMSMLRMGKRPMSMLRMGKRPMSMLRMGKRPMSMLRMGKRPMSMLRMGKRPMSMLRMGKRPMSMLRMGKRPMSMLRMGKRPMSMLRMGKKSDGDHSIETRKINMLRLGRSD